MDYKHEMNSDDEFDCPNSYGDHDSTNSSGTPTCSSQNNSYGLSKAELRKTNKPIMEKKRRARINHCLNELKSLILEAMKKDPARHTKLEKADILEMTVKHLQSVQRQQLSLAIQTDPSVIHKFKSGFGECAEEVNRYVRQLDGVDPTVCQRLIGHLNNCASSLEQIGSMSNFTKGYQLSQMNTSQNVFNGNSVTSTGNMFPSIPQDLNNNLDNNRHHNGSDASIQMGEVQLIPSRLSSGEFALIVPNSGTNNTSSVSASFATWSSQNSINTALKRSEPLPQVSDLPISLQRLSAFSIPSQQNATVNAVYNSTTTQKSHITTFSNCITSEFYHAQNNLHHNSTTTTSPPLSPISSVSSQSEESEPISNIPNGHDISASRPTTPSNTDSNNKHFSAIFSTPPSSADTSIAGLDSSIINLQQHQVSSTSGYNSCNTSSELNSSSTSLKRPFHDSFNESDVCGAEGNSTKKFHVQEDDRDMWRPW